MNWDEVWRELARALLLRGYLPVGGVEYWAHQDGIPMRLVRGVVAALGVEEFENGGEHYWRLSGKVVPIFRAISTTQSPIAMQGVVLREALRMGRAG